MEAYQPLMILIAGPYRSGTGDDPVSIAANMHRMEEAAMEVYRKGHIPILGEWLSLPLISMAGSRSIGDEVFTEYFHPASMRLLEKCDAVLRIGGASFGTSEMIRAAQESGKILFLQTDDIPEVSSLVYC
jgi:hypothetical protein